METDISVIIPSYKPDEGLKKLLDRIWKQSLTPREVLVINTDKNLFPFSQEELPGRTGVFHIGREEFDHGGTRDKAFSMTSGDIVVCMTQDALPCGRDLLKNLAAAFEDPDVAAAYARQVPRKNAGILEKITRQFNYGSEGHVYSREDLKEKGIKTFFCSNVCAAWKRAVYYSEGGFEKHTIFNEDMILAARLIMSGYKIAYVPGAGVYHSHNYSGLMQLRRNFDLGVSQADHPEIFNLASSSGEGVKLVKDTAMKLIERRKIHLLPELVWQSGCKYSGYILGKNYKRLPEQMAVFLSMNKGYWKSRRNRNDSGKRRGVTG